MLLLGAVMAIAIAYRLSGGDWWAFCLELVGAVLLFYVGLLAVERRGETTHYSPED